MTRIVKGNTVQYLGGVKKYRGETALVREVEKQKVRNIFNGTEGEITEEEFVRIVFLDGHEMVVRPHVLILLDVF